MIVGAGSAEEKMQLVTYLAAKMGMAPRTLVGQMPFEVAAITRKGLPLGAVIYLNFRVATIEMACAGEPGWLTPGTLRDAFAYPFNTLGVWTILTHTARTNHESRKFQKRLGFREIGVIECGPNKNDDAILYSMTRTECQWLNIPQSEAA